ncbi:unnamed protein product [Linum trigynum]|uniref:F-box domain-containing protein n=1 Tax=Linum trigynum TaxID=586398 RepID=A0AAV2DDV8_9ROSI
MDLWLRSLKSKAIQLLVTEIDSVFLEFGFVGYHTVDQKNSTLSVSYTLPALNDQTKNKVPPSVQVKFQPLANFLVICGSLARENGSPLRRLVFNKAGAFASVITSGEVTEFRRTIKDGLCFPLLIDITEEAGLPVPNCFSTLPDELKLGIMALLPAEALARMECACAGLRILSASSNQLWEAKYCEVFGKVVVAEAGSSSSVEKNWRKRFTSRAEKKRKLAKEKEEKMGLLLEKRVRFMRDYYIKSKRRGYNNA